MPRARTQDLLHLSWQGMLSDYVTVLAWTPDDNRLAAGSAAESAAAAARPCQAVAGAPP